MSARRPIMKVTVARERPIMVRYWKCQPYDWLMWFGLAERLGVVSLGVLNRDVRFYKLNE